MDLPASLTSKTDAVNTLLQTIGEAPVNSIETSQAVDVAAALSCINEIDLAVQTRGWSWNREDAMPLSVDDSGQIPLPANKLFVSSAYSLGAGSRIVERAGKLYDRDNRTYTFTDPATVDLVLRLEWEEMPEYARRYITIRAAKLFQGRLQSSRIVDEITDMEVMSALAVCEQREDEAEPQNSITGNSQTAARVYGRGRRRVS